MQDAGAPPDLDRAELWAAVEGAAAAAGIGLVVTVIDGPHGPHPVYVSDHVLEILGYTREEFLARPSLSNVPDDERARLAAIARDRVAGRPVPRRVETVMIAKDGRRVPVEAGGGHTLWRGRPASVSFLRDLTPGLAARERLVNLETIYNATIDGLLFVDRERRLVSANRRFAELFGFQPEDVHTLPPEVVRARARSLYADPSVFDEGLRAYEPENWRLVYDHEVELVGRPARFVHEHSEPIFDARGEYVGRVWTYRDVTRERTLARELERYAQTLEDEVAKRSDKLAQAQKMAALGQLVAGVAHEINNPLAYVKSNTETLRESWGDVLSNADVRAWLDGDRGRARPALEWLADSGHLKFIVGEMPQLIDANLKGIRRIQDIVAELRAFATPRVQTREPRDVNAVLEDAVRIFRAQFADRIEVESRYGDVPLVRCDPGKIGQVVMNLLVNAAQAVDGRGRVRVRSRLDGDVAIIEIEDNGRGIPAGEITNIFDPFYTTKDGMGLGLSISYTIVKEHGGEIGVVSTPGEGTTFSVRLPLGPAERAQ